MATEAMELTATSNPYLDFYNDFCKARKQELFKVFDPSIGEKKRRKMYKQLDVGVAMKYAWAIPDERALRIIKHYGPIVEMGAGTGYWGRLLQLRGVDIVCYDLHTADDDASAVEGSGDDAESGSGEEDVDEEDEDDSEGEEEDGPSTASDADEQNDDEEDEEDGSSDADSEEEVEVEQIYWMDVQKGTPKVLQKHSDRTLLLCYPDDFDESSESMALQALQNYSGDCVIHVGEMFGQTLCLPGPWGRTSASEFQIHLASIYHKVLQVPLPSWHSSIDTLTVWKRTKTSMMDNCFYAYIPENERLDLVQTCPSTRHLLEDTDTQSTGKRKAEASTPAAANPPQSEKKKAKKQKQARK